MTDPSSELVSSTYRQALEVIESVEPRIAAATRQELADQRGSLKLIASENYASPAVLLTMGTWFSDKYAEGTVGHRFYAGCQNVDTVEALAAEHARELGVLSLEADHRGHEPRRDHRGRLIGERRELTDDHVGDVPRVPVDELADERLLVREVLVDRADAHPRALRDAVGAGLVVALPHQNVSGGVEDRVHGRLGSLLSRPFSGARAHSARHRSDLDSNASCECEQ